MDFPKKKLFECLQKGFETMRPKYSKDQIVTLKNFIPPLLSGSQVAIKDVRDTGRQFMYQVESVEYSAEPKWVHQDDLQAPLEVMS